MAFARAAADQALVRDSQYAPAQALLGSIAMLYDQDPSKAAEHLTHALTLDPYAAVAAVFAWRGETDLAFEWLEEAVQHKDPALGAVPANPAFDRLHSDPRWLPFLRKHGMAPEQVEAIKFDVKVPK